jgi:hypothetical protein
MTFNEVQLLQIIVVDLPENNNGRDEGEFFFPTKTSS